MVKTGKDSSVYQIFLCQKDFATFLQSKSANDIKFYDPCEGSAFVHACDANDRHITAH